MKNNKLICVILALLVCLTMVVSASAANDNELSFALSSESVKEDGIAIVTTGEVMTVIVKIENNPGFTALVADIEFDHTALELVGEPQQLCDLSKDLYNANSIAGVPGTVRMNLGDWSAVKGVKADVLNTTGDILKLSFKALKSGSTSIKLSVSGKNVADKDGKTEKITVSGAELNVTVIEPDHEHVEKVIEGKAPTCTEPGLSDGKVCAICGAVLEEQKEVAATGHKLNSGEIIKAPTCTEMGSKKYSCENCDYTETDDKVPAEGHKFGDWTVTKEATLEAAGEETRTCSVCGEKETREIPQLTEGDSNSSTIIIVIVAVVVVLAGAGVAAYFVLKNKKKQ